MQVNRLDALTIAVSENRFSQIATRTILTDDALSVPIPSPGGHSRLELSTYPRSSTRTARFSRLGQGPHGFVDNCAIGGYILIL